ncbi:MAG TPA: GntR family transcriptional regulator [Myxococcota bacterium]|nr:GntR family transcriptional regulator [Myxococcota bacterium]HRY97344.1 GntR family transcriptional regulator [Myxococcota bacterium]
MEALAEATWRPLEQIRATTSVDQLADRIRHKILSGEIPTGSMLPPERKWSLQLGVSRTTVRAALARLVSEGLVSIRQGRGAEVQDFRRIGGLGLVEKMPRSLQDATFPGVLELRTAVALELVTLACERASTEQLDQLEALAKQIEQTEDPFAVADLDLEFSRTLCRAADNLPMELMLNTISLLYTKRPDIPLALFEQRDDVRMSYVALVELLRSRSATGIREALREGLNARDRLTLERLAIPPRAP